MFNIIDRLYLQVHNLRFVFMDASSYVAIFQLVSNHAISLYYRPLQLTRFLHPHVDHISMWLIAISIANLITGAKIVRKRLLCWPIGLQLNYLN